MLQTQSSQVMMRGTGSPDAQDLWSKLHAALATSRALSARLEIGQAQAPIGQRVEFVAASATVPSLRITVVPLNAFSATIIQSRFDSQQSALHRTAKVELQP